MKATVIKAKIPNSAPFGGMPMVFTEEDVGPKDVDVGPLVVPGDPDGDPAGDPEGLLQRSPSQQLTSQCGMDKSTTPPSAPPNTLCNVLHVRFFAMPHANFIVQFRMLKCTSSSPKSDMLNFMVTLVVEHAAANWPMFGS